MSLSLGSSGYVPPRAKVINTNVALTTGLLTTVSTYGLLAAVAFAKTGGNTNLTINTSTGGVSAAVALGPGITQTISGTITGADGVVLPFVDNLTGAANGSAPGYLATISAAQYLSIGVQKLNASYTGPLLQVTKTDGSASMDVSPISGTDFPDYAAVAAWAGSSVVLVSRLYRQDGSALYGSQATVANMPSWDLTNAISGVPVPIIFDGNPTGENTTGDPVAVKFLDFVAGGINLNAHSTFLTIEALVSQEASIGYLSFYDGAGAGIENFYANTGQLLYRTFGGNQTQTQQSVEGIVPRVSRNTIGGSVGATATIRYANGAITSGGRVTASVDMANFRLGKSTFAAGTDFPGMFKFFGLVSYATNVNNTDGAAVVAGMNTAFSIPSTYDYRWAGDGDSINASVGARNLQKGTVDQVKPLLTMRAEIFNISVPGQTMATAYAQRTLRHLYLYTASYPTIFTIQEGTNDINAGTSGAALYTTATNLITYLRTLGTVKIILCTILPRGAFNDSGAKETERLAYNAAVVANTAGADVILDLAANTEMGSNVLFVDDTTKYRDRTHPTPLGYSYLSGAAGASNYNHRYALEQAYGATP